MISVNFLSPFLSLSLSVSHCLPLFSLSVHFFNEICCALVCQKATKNTPFFPSWSNEFINHSTCISLFYQQTNKSEAQIDLRCMVLSSAAIFAWKYGASVANGTENMTFTPSITSSAFFLLSRIKVPWTSARPLSSFSLSIFFCFGAQSVDHYSHGRQSMEKVHQIIVE